MQSMFSEHNGIKLDISSSNITKKTKPDNLENKQHFSKQFMGQKGSHMWSRQYFKLKDNENTTYQIL